MRRSQQGDRQSGRQTTAQTGQQPVPRTGSLQGCDEHRTTAANKLVEQVSELFLSRRLVLHLLEIIQHEQMGGRRLGAPFRQAIRVNRISQAAGIVRTTCQHNGIVRTTLPPTLGQSAGQQGLSSPTWTDENKRTVAVGIGKQRLHSDLD